MGIIKRFASEEYVVAQQTIIGEQFESLKSNAVLFIPQTLTEDQKAQVRANIGIVNQNVSDTTTPESGENEESITTEYVYTYDGDVNSETNKWILNYSGLKIFAKLGEIPNGTLNLEGATVFRTNPSNQWLDRTFTITADHLTDTVDKSNVTLSATIPGMIQIFDQHSSDFSKFTVLCICTEPGWYDITFDDWYEVINFPETGIYGYDKRSYGGNDYLKTFTFSATVSSNNNGNENNSSDNTVVLTPVQYKGNEIQTFSRGICIGDSVTEGSFDNNENGAIIKKYSYPAILKRITNIDIVNAGIAGMTSKTWYESSLNSDTQWGKWVNDEWVWNTNPQVGETDIVSTALNYSNFDFAIIHLGINDLGLMGDATIEETILTFEENIANIINSLKNANNGIKIFFATIVPSYAPPGSTYYKALNDKIKNMAEIIDNVYLLDLNKYSTMASHEAYNRTHPTALGYNKLATDIASYISYIISENLNDFNAVQFIGTDYTL